MEGATAQSRRCYSLARSDKAPGISYIGKCCMNWPVVACESRHRLYFMKGIPCIPLSDISME